MKIRNKKTGEIVEFISIESVDDEIEFTYTKVNGHENAWSYRSLKKFNDDWEDYNPKEPLIKDEKVCKAVRAFSEVVQENNHIFVIKQRSLGIVEFCIGSRFLTALPVSDETSDAIEDRTYYTIAELCGDEE